METPELNDIVADAISAMLRGEGTVGVTKYVTNRIEVLKAEQPEQITRETLQTVMGKAKGAVDTLAQCIPHLG